jgi:hypothetical protein
MDNTINNRPNNITTTTKSWTTNLVDLFFIENLTGLVAQLAKKERSNETQCFMTAITKIHIKTIS